MSVNVGFIYLFRRFPLNTLCMAASSALLSILTTSFSFFVYLSNQLGMLGLASADSFLHLTLANGCVGIGSATALAGAGLYLADLSTPRNRAQTNAPVSVHVKGRCSIFVFCCYIVFLIFSIVNAV
jgi:signal transduction histidine kinase